MSADGNEASSEKRAVDYVVDALQRLGGIGHLHQIYGMYCHISGRLRDANTEAKVRQTLQTFSSDASWERPRSAPDLFYSVDGVSEASGVWGLRRFSAQAPYDYPRLDLDREYVVLLRRSETTLFNVRGIAYKDGRVLGIHVNFGLDGDYPDRLLDDGKIEHIGEGKGDIQTATGGNAGMLRAIETGERIPVYQFIQSDRYAPLGDYIVKAHRREAVGLSSGDSVEAFIFTLEPASNVNDERLRTVSESDIATFAAEAASVSFLLGAEGNVQVRTHLARERDPGNRSAVIRLKGVRSEACGFHFGEHYGPEIDGFIEVHHARPLASGPYVPTVKDFAVLCANCHRAAHKGRGLTPRTVDELRSLIRGAQTSADP